MAYRNAGHLRSHLSVFEPTYPIQKGYIARLLLDHTITEVTTAIKAIVETAEPDKILNEGTLMGNLSRFKKFFKNKKSNLTREWQSLIKLFLEHFPITFRSLPSLPASANIIPITPTSSSSSVSNFPELTCTPISETQNSTDTTPPQMQILQTFVASDSESCGLSSPNKLKVDCASCVSKEQTNLQLMEEIKELQQQLNEVRTTVGAGCSLKRLNEKLKRKNESIRLWKSKYAVVKKECKNTKRRKESLNVSQQQIETLERHMDELQEEKQNLSVVIEQQRRLHEKLEEDYVSLKCKYVKLHRESNSVKNAMHVTVKDLIYKNAQLEHQVVMLTHCRDVVSQKNDENTMDR
ncbi:hypothetical protein BsWGS_29054 [Bradybaena similaris]